MPEGSDVRVPLTDGNGEGEPTAGNGDDCGALVEDAGPEGPLTAGNGELPLD